MKVSVVTFPGSNCDRDVGQVLSEYYSAKVSYVWHKDPLSGNPDLVVLPGGFSYGDYLRCGAMAKVSRVMQDILPYAQKGGRVLGICNGFQILTESGLLPGALLMNQKLKYICRNVELISGSPQNPISQKISKPSLTLPIAHGEGSYFADTETIRILNSENRILFRYKTNPNGSIESIAGILSSNSRVVGLMPHPERAMNPCSGNMDGRLFFDSYLNN